jgi:hypothetical protein
MSANDLPLIRLDSLLNYADDQKVVPGLQIHRNQKVELAIPYPPARKAVYRGSSLIHFPKLPIHLAYHSMTRWRRMA